MRNFFITGTDTGVGKTHVTALLLAELRRRGINAGGFKPIACGRDGRHDARTYRTIMGGAVPLATVNPVYLRAPLAPAIAAARERRRIDRRVIQRAYVTLARAYAPLLVEGAGGLLVPIDRDYFVADLARDLGLPVIIVARLGLGTINHTLLTVRQARASGLAVAGLILNDTVGGRRGLADRTNIRAVPELARVPLLGVVGHGATDVRRLADAVIQLAGRGK